MKNEQTERKISAVICKSEGIKAREIARKLDLNRRTVNHVLYNSPLLRELSAQMLGYWKIFITTGDPNGGDLPKWEQNHTSDSVMLFGDTTGMISEKEHELFAVLDQKDGWK